MPRERHADPIVVLHDDGSLVAVDKPAGEPVIAARGEPPSACVQKRLERQLGRRIFVVHRIDRDASGVVLFALDAAAHRAASLAFEHRRVEKQYLAFVAGVLDARRWTARRAAARGATGQDAAGAPGRAGRPGRGHRLRHAKAMAASARAA